MADDEDGLVHREVVLAGGDDHVGPGEQPPTLDPEWWKSDGPEDPDRLDSRARGTTWGFSRTEEEVVRWTSPPAHAGTPSWERGPRREECGSASGRRSAAASSWSWEGRAGARTPERDDEGYWGASCPDLAAGGALPVPPGRRGALSRPRVALPAAGGARTFPGGRSRGVRLVGRAAGRGRDLEDLVVYELHVGTFTPEGHVRGGAREARRSCGTSASPRSS